MAGEIHIMRVEKACINTPWEIWESLIQKAQIKEARGDQGFLYIFKKEMKEILKEKVKAGKISSSDFKRFLENFKEYKDTDEIDLWLFW